MWKILHKAKRNARTWTRIEHTCLLTCRHKQAHTRTHTHTHTHTRNQGHTHTHPLTHAHMHKTTRHSKSANLHSPRFELSTPWSLSRRGKKRWDSFHPRQRQKLTRCKNNPFQSEGKRRKEKGQKTVIVSKNKTIRDF